MKNGWKFILGIAVGAIAGYYVGAMFDFFPFLANDMAVRAAGFGTLIVCIVVAICTFLIISKIEKKGTTDTEAEK